MAAAGFQKASGPPRSKSISAKLCAGGSPNLPYDEAAATWHGEEGARLDALGKPAPFIDGQIAAVAHVHGLVLVTTNESHFAGFKGLEVENWSKP